MIANEPSTADPEDLELPDLSRCNMLELSYYLEICGLGLPRTEAFFVMLSMKNLVQEEPISSIRFWGKIMGTLKNYFVVECELKEEEYIKRNESYQEAERKSDLQKETDEMEESEYAKALGVIANEQLLPGEGGGKYPRKLPPEPQNQYVEPPEPPAEPAGVGVNKMVISMR